MTADRVVPDPEQLERLGLYDPGAPGANDRLALIEYAAALGASLEEIAASQNLGELALDLQLRPRLDSTLSEVVEATGLDWTGAKRVLSAFGLTVEPDQRVTVDEEQTIRLLATVKDLVGEDATVQIARVAGNAMARVAEAVVTAFRLQFELPRRAAGMPEVDVVKQYVDIAESLLPAFVRTLDVLLRRQIVAVAQRMWSTDEEQSAVTLPRTVGFVDLVGYTSAAASMSVRELTSVLLAFDERTAEIVLSNHGHIVKAIGDEALFVTEIAADACRIAIELVQGFGDGHLPQVRVGLAAGQVLSVLGDVYGPDVNLAARLVAAADPSTVVVSEDVWTACREEFRFVPLSPVELKGFPGRLGVYRLELS